MILLNENNINETYYCFPDIHGMYNLLRDALNFVYRRHPAGGKIIFLGDYIDRGPDNKSVLETVMYPPEKWEFVCLMGNHEDIFLDAYKRKTEFYDQKVLLEYYHGGGLIHYDTLHSMFPKEIVEWMSNLKMFHFEGNNVFAHAYYDDNLLPEWQSKLTTLWERMDDWQTFRSKNDRLYLTHGHTPRKNGPIQSPNRTNLDCGAVYNNRYVIGEYRKGIRGPVNFHEFK